MTEQAAQMMSERQAFDAMRQYLTSYWERFDRSLVSDVLSDTQPAFLADSVTADPAAWDDWTAAVRKVMGQQ